MTGVFRTASRSNERQNADSAKGRVGLGKLRRRGKERQAMAASEASRPANDCERLLRRPLPEALPHH